MGQTSSSSWEGPITESQAVAVSDHLLTEQEAAIYHSEDGDEESDISFQNEGVHRSGQDQDLGEGPSWEIGIPPRMRSIEYPRNMGAMQCLEKMHTKHIGRHGRRKLCRHLFPTHITGDLH